MAVQDIYISPKQILSYLIEFEKRLPMPKKDYYKPSLTSTPISESDLNSEARRMMDFLGLTEYKPQCKWSELKEGTGGNVTLNNNPNKIVEINVDSKYRNNIDAAVAILAHEICHKYLYVHNVYYPIEIINEIYTDLCTMYVGFGKIIIYGYITQTKSRSYSKDSVTEYTNTQYLGYLKFPIYSRTSHIIRLVLWDEDPASVLTEQDPFLLDAFKKWIGAKDKREICRSSFHEIGAPLAETHKLHNIISRLLADSSARHSKPLIKADASLYNSEWFDENSIKPQFRFTVFESVYRNVIQLEQQSESEEITKSNRFLRHLVVHLWNHSSHQDATLLTVNEIVCPFCGHTMPSAKIAGRKTIVKCSKCLKRFAVDCTDFDMMTAKNDFDNFHNELIAPIRKGYNELMAKKSQEANRRAKVEYEKGLREGSVKYDALRKKIDSLPGWLKKLIGNRLD